VKVGKAGKEGLKPWQTADAAASFTVKAYEPPTIGCSANPAIIKPGETSSIAAAAVSPQNRPLSYRYAAAAGSISGSGSSAVFSSTGAPTGATAITCSVSDDKGQTATASTSVTITAPYVAPVPHVQALCAITFEKDSKRPARVDNEAKACLDEVALDLEKQSDARVVLVGDATAAEKSPKKAAGHAKVAPPEDLAAERAVNTKDYLVTEKGIDASRVSVATGLSDGQKVENYLTPAGASFAADVTGTTPVDESAVKPLARKALAVRPPHKKGK
jgi:outer membrane protein OmpA-like peptidoglycan-associated protein